MSKRLTGTEAYYDRRAPEFDAIYDKPERQEQLSVLKRRVSETFEGLDVLEVAAGTGYWTQFFADEAQSVVATDVNQSVLNLASARRSWPDSVEFRLASAFDLDVIPGVFNAAFVGFLWSHIPLAVLDQFIGGLGARLDPRSRVLLIDNRYVAHSNSPVTRIDELGDSYQARTLADGSQWEVLKNFPTPTDLRNRLDPIADQLSVTELEHFWIADFTTCG